MVSIVRIYLNPDGVLHPNVVCHDDGTSRLTAPGHEPFEYAPYLTEILENHANLKLVLNTWWAFSMGLVANLELLPDVIATRVVDATLHSASTYEHFPDRIEEAEKHIALHANEAFLILDHSNARYPKHLKTRAILIDGTLGLSSLAARRALSRALERTDDVRLGGHKGILLGATHNA
jgi:hypothetical protein